MSFRDISPRQAAEWMSSEPDSVFVVDVREEFEHDIAKVEGTTLIPLGQLGGRAGEIPKDRRILCLCHHGGRSARACQILAMQGFERLYNIAGGIHVWAEDVDQSIAQY